MKRSSSVQFGESAGRATAVTQRAARVLHEPSTKTQGGMERADEPAELVFPPTPLVARVIVGPVPEAAPASLAGFLESVVDDEGRVVDWHIDRERPFVASDLMDYAEWRGSWERTWELGPLTNLRSLSRIVGELENVPGLAALLEALVADAEATRIEPSTVPDLPAELDAVRAAIAGTPDQGTAIVDQTPRRTSTVGFSRTWSTPAEPQLLAANSTTGVLVDPVDGLVVVARATGARRLVDVVEADLRGDVVVVTNRLGETLELEGAAARPIAWIVPTSLRWKVRPIPQVVVWSALFSRLPDALRVASAMRGDISFSIDRDS